MAMSLLSFSHSGFGTIVVSIGLSLALSSCAKPPLLPPPPPPKPTVFQMEMTVAPNVNPDLRGRPSPVVSRLYELKSLALFQTADFLSLFDRDKDFLGSDLVAKEELVFQPGEVRQFTRELHSETRFVAFIAAYRDIERSRWRISMPVPLHETTIVRINVEKNEIAIIHQ
jgi:type VI secretion system protein VasD